MRRTGLEARIGAGNFHLRVEDAVAAFRGHSVTRSASPRINRPGGRHLRSHCGDAGSGGTAPGFSGSGLGGFGSSMRVRSDSTTS
jgi:hypothetical protein